MKHVSRKSALGVFAATGTVFAAGLPAHAADSFTFRLSAPTPASSVLARAALKFAANVSQRTNGQLKIEVYPSGQIAKEQEAIDSLASGVIDMAVESYAFLVSLFPRFQVIQTPFLFRSLASGLRVLDGQIGHELFSDLETRGVVGLAWGTDGFRQLSTTTRAITVPEDMKGLRIRIQGGQIYAATYQALGAIPVAIDLAEVYPALQQHTIDGVDVSMDSAALLKYYNVIKHETLLNSVLSVVPMIASKRKLESLPAPLQQIVRDEAKNVVPYWRALTNSQIAEDVEILKKNGVAFSEINFAAFRKAAEPVYTLVQNRLGGDFLNRVIQAAGPV